MYNFDIKALLDTFDGDPEKLANEFANQLNTELANQRKQNNLNETTEYVADAWNDFVDEYFEQYSLPNGFVENDFYVNPESITKLLEFFTELAPYIQALNEYTTKVKDITTKAKTEIKNASTATADNFSLAMNKFFDKYDIH